LQISDKRRKGYSGFNKEKTKSGHTSLYLGITDTGASHYLGSASFVVAGDDKLVAELKRDTKILKTMRFPDR